MSQARVSRMRKYACLDQTVATIFKLNVAELPMYIYCVVRNFYVQGPFVVDQDYLEWHFLSKNSASKVGPAPPSLDMWKFGF